MLGERVWRKRLNTVKANRIDRQTKLTVFIIDYQIFELSSQVVIIHNTLIFPVIIYCKVNIISTYSFLIIPVRNSIHIPVVFRISVLVKSCLYARFKNKKTIKTNIHYFFG